MVHGKSEVRSRGISCTASEANACRAWEGAERRVRRFSALAVDERFHRRNQVQSDVLECRSTQAAQEEYPVASSNQDLDRSLSKSLWGFEHKLFVIRLRFEVLCSFDQRS